MAKDELHRRFLAEAHYALCSLRLQDPEASERICILRGDHLQLHGEYSGEDSADAKSQHDPELAAEIRICAANAQREHRDWFKIVLENGNVFLESVPGTTAPFEEEPPWVRSGESFELARRLEPHEVPPGLL